MTRKLAPPSPKGSSLHFGGMNNWDLVGCAGFDFPSPPSQLPNYDVRFAKRSPGVFANFGGMEWGEWAFEQKETERTEKERIHFEVGTILPLRHGGTEIRQGKSQYSGTRQPCWTIREYARTRAFFEILGGRFWSDQGFEQKATKVTKVKILHFAAGQI
jgi:hypothetical protein